MVRWRQRNRGIYSAPIYDRDWHLLFNRMKEEGLTVTIDDRVRFFYGEYEITPKEIRRVWCISPAQYRKLRDKCIVMGGWVGDDIPTSD